jgi:NAD(P)-dependent dehydrogenase (short-subunit alcohol dehydrogenase family)
MDHELQGMHAVVTGAARGIGAAIARMLAQEGARVSLLGRNEAALRALADALPGESFAATADVADEAQVARAFAKARERFGPVRILVNNAGQAETAPVVKTPLDLWQRMLAVNLTGTFLCSQAALPDMLAARAGRIVNIASSAGLHGYRYGAAYSASKHGVVGLTRSLSLEVADRGITVNALCPGYVETDMVRAGIANVVARGGRTAEEARAHFVATNPQGRIVQAEEIADAVRWLCGAGAAGVNGAAIPITGGGTV